MYSIDNNKTEKAMNAAVEKLAEMDRMMRKASGIDLISRLVSPVTHTTTPEVNIALLSGNG